MKNADMPASPMSNDYTLPPLPLPAAAAFAPQVQAYGHACAEAVRAPLLARIAKLEQEVERLDSSESQLIEERDHAEEIIDKLCDAVLGSDREEWSSGYFFTHAVADVEKEMTGLRAEVDELRRPLTDEEIAFCIFEARKEAGPFLRRCTLTFRIARLVEKAHIDAVGKPWVNPLAAEVEKYRADAERWHEVRRGQTLSVVDWVGVHLRAESADAAVDAAIAARKGEGSEAAAQAKAGAE